MRKLISILLLIAAAGGLIASLWVWKIPVRETLSTRWMMDANRWEEKPATRVSVLFTGADIYTLEPAARRIAFFLSPFDGQLRQTRVDSPVPQVELAAVLPQPAVLPLRELAERMIEEQTRGARAAVRAVKPAHHLKKAKPPKVTHRKRGTKETVSPKLREHLRRKQMLTQTLIDSEKSHVRIAESRRQYRHPEELLKNDAEAMDLKAKLTDLEMTLAEVIDHYTPAHPRVREIQNDISAVRSSLDRRVVVAEQEEKSRWEQKRQDIQRRLRALEREEKQLRSAGAARIIEPAAAAATESSEEEKESEAPAVAAMAGLRMNWIETQTIVREIVEEKQLDTEKIVMDASVGIASLALAGYLLGLLGFFTTAGRMDMSKQSPEEEAMAESKAFPAAAPGKIRKPLPPITTAPEPPMPEKIIEEKELPGEAWVTMPLLPQIEKGLYTVFAPTSAAAEFFSKTAGDILSRLPKSQGSQVIAVSAVRSGTGTSTFLANLAVSILPQRPVVLVDLHHTAPGLHTLFSIPASAQDLMASVPWNQIVAPTPLDRLFLLPQFSPHLEKEMTDLKLKKRIQSFVKENPADRLILVDVAPIGRSDVFEEIAETSDLFLLVLGPDPTPASAKPALKRLAKAMKNKPLLRVARTDVQLPNALSAKPPADFQFAELPG